MTLVNIFPEFLRKVLDWLRIVSIFPRKLLSDKLNIRREATKLQIWKILNSFIFSERGKNASSKDEKVSMILTKTPHSLISCKISRKLANFFINLFISEHSSTIIGNDKKLQENSFLNIYLSYIIKFLRHSHSHSPPGSYNFFSYMGFTFRYTSLASGLELGISVKIILSKRGINYHHRS